MKYRYEKKVGKITNSLLIDYFSRYAPLIHSLSTTLKHSISDLQILDFFANVDKLSPLIIILYISITALFP